MTQSPSSATTLKHLFLFVSLFAVIGSVATAQEDEAAEKIRNFLEEEHELSMDFVTPHTRWAKPYARGPVRVVFFAPWFQGSTDGREIIELMQRFDIDGHAIYCTPEGRPIGDGRPDWYGGDPEAGTKRALRLLEEPEAIFINQLRLDALPGGIRDAILRRVAAGAGLVLIGGQAPEGSQPATDEGLAFGQSLVLGKGRVALLPTREKLSHARRGWEVAFDHQMAAQGRALLWTAGKAPASKLEIQCPQHIMRCQAGAEMTVSWADAPPAAELSVALRRWDDECIAMGALKMSDARNPLRLELPEAAAGSYHVEAFIRDGEAVVDWAIQPVTITSDRSVEGIRLAKDWAEPGERIQGTVVVTGAVGDRDRVVVRIQDKDGRILLKKREKIRNNRVSFAFLAEDGMPMLLWVRAAIVDGDHEVASAEAPVRITQRHRGQFHFVMWNAPTGDLAPYGVQSLARQGVTAILQSGDVPLSFAANDLAFVPYAASFRASSHTTTAMLDAKTGWLRTGCVYDEAKMAEAVAQAVKGAARAREHGVFVYSLGDENAVRASCLSPHCLEAYRTYLRDIYGKIERLNAEWGTDYAGFDGVELESEGALPAEDAPGWFRDYYSDWRQLHLTDSEGAKGEELVAQVELGAVNDELRALQAGNFARWYDRQAFQNQTYLEWCKRFQRAFRQLDPQAWTGFEGTDSFSIRRLTTRSRQGGDLDGFAREMDYFGPYHGPANEVVRSIAPPGYPMGNWIGYEPGADVLLGEYWEQVTNGMNTVQWWRWDNLDGYHGYLLPTLSPFPAVRELVVDTQVMRDGLGALLMQCRMEDDGIAMLYSMPSTYIAHFDGNATYGDYARDHDAWHDVIHRAGLQFRYVTDRMLRLGEFDAAAYRVLILPLAFAMTAEEAAVVRRFVAEGGTVLADVRPALYDGHCKPLGEGQLDDVFGIARTGRRDALEVDRLSVHGDVGGHGVEMKWGNWHGRDVYPRMKVDPSVALAGGKGLGEAFQVHYWAGLKTPVCVVNEYGKGRAVLLNFSIFQAPAQRLVAELLAAAGVEPVVRVDRPDVEVTRWRNGDCSLVALLAEHDGDVAVTLPVAGFVNDIKGRQSLGKVRAFAAGVRANRASYYEIQPRAAAAPCMTLKPSTVTRGGRVHVTVRVPGSDGKRAVMVWGKGPSGEPVAWMEGTVIAGGDGGGMTWPVAWNDVPGDYEITATDIASGAVATATLHVR